MSTKHLHGLSRGGDFSRCASVNSRYKCEVRLSWPGATLENVHDIRSNTLAVKLQLRLLVASGDLASTQAFLVSLVEPNGLLEVALIRADETNIHASGGVVASLNALNMCDFGDWAIAYYIVLVIIRVGVG